MPISLRAIVPIEFLFNHADKTINCPLTAVVCRDDDTVQAKEETIVRLALHLNIDIDSVKIIIGVGI